MSFTFIAATFRANVCVLISNAQELKQWFIGLPSFHSTNCCFARCNACPPCIAGSIKPAYPQLSEVAKLQYVKFNFIHCLIKIGIKMHKKEDFVQSLHQWNLWCSLASEDYSAFDLEALISDITILWGVVAAYAFFGSCYVVVSALTWSITRCYAEGASKYSRPSVIHCLPADCVFDLTSLMPVQPPKNRQMTRRSIMGANGRLNPAFSICGSGVQPMLGARINDSWYGGDKKSNN